MTSTDKAKQVLEKMTFEVSDPLRQEMKNAMRGAYTPTDWKRYLKRLAIPMAACLVLLLILQAQRPTAVRAPNIVNHPGETLAEMTCSWSLQRAFKTGGLEALDEHFYKTNRYAGPRPDCLSINDFFNDGDL